MVCALCSWIVIVRDLAELEQSYIQKKGTNNISVDP